jgi:hypothetical protein
VIRFHRSRNDTHVPNDAAVNVKHRIKHQRAQRLVRRRFRRRNPCDDGLENFLDTNSHFRARFDRFLRRDGQDFFQLAFRRGNVSIWQVDLVDDRNNGETLFVREVNVRHRLRFHALRRVHDQHRALTRSEAARNFVGKIDVPRRIEQIQPIGLTRLACVTHRHRMCLNCDPPLALQVHRIKKLVLPLALLDRAGALQQPVGQRRLAVIDVRDDAKIARQLNGHESATMRVRASAVNWEHTVAKEALRSVIAWRDLI